jgi:chemotaxis protein methyltransferase CheR
MPGATETVMSAEAAKRREFVFTDTDFNSIRKLVRDVSGITLAESKRELVYGRLSRRLRHLGMDSFADYRALLASAEGQSEIGEFTNAVTTNLTSFFRENHHFDYLKNQFLLPLAANPAGTRRLRIWCSAASTGEEPFSIAMTVADAIPDWERWDIKILATDLDTDVLAQCTAASYKEERIAAMPRARVEKYFDRAGTGATLRYRVKPALTRMIAFRQLNLMNPLPMKGPLDVIFCRNVIIYFDKDTQRELFKRMAPLQRPGDLMFLGHSESLFKVSEAWNLIGKTIYRRGNAC